MGRAILVDTGAWLAAFHRRDQYHAVAAMQLRRLREAKQPFVVTDLILAELHLHLVRGLGPRAAATHLATLKADPLTEEVFTDRDLQRAAVSDWLFHFEDQPFTLTDAVSFAVMRKRKLKEAFTFDRHFHVAGFRMVPSSPLSREGEGDRG